MIKSEDELRDFYNSTLAHRVEEVNATVKKNCRTACVFLLFSLGFYVSYWLWGDFFATWGTICIWALLLICAFLSLAYYWGRYEKCTQVFVQEIVPKIIEWLPRDKQNSKLKFYWKKTVDEGDYYAVNVYPGGAKIEGRYLIEGMLAKVPLRFGEVHKQIRYRNGNKEERSDFCGLVIKLSFNKIFHRHHYIIDKIRDKHGISCVKNNVIKVQNPKIINDWENVDFDRAFTVFSEDDTEARYLLSPTLMEQLVNIRRRLQCVTNVAFPGWRRDSAIHILLDGYTDILCLNNLKKVDFEAVLRMYRRIVPILYLVSYLDLEQRLWSKTF